MTDPEAITSILGSVADPIWPNGPNLQSAAQQQKVIESSAQLSAAAMRMAGRQALRQSLVFYDSIPCMDAELFDYQDHKSCVHVGMPASKILQ